MPAPRLPKPDELEDNVDFSPETASPGSVAGRAPFSLTVSPPNPPVADLTPPNPPNPLPPESDDKAPIVPKGEVVEAASAPNPDAANAEDEVCLSLAVSVLGLDEGSGDLLRRFVSGREMAVVFEGSLAGGT